MIDLKADLESSILNLIEVFKSLPADTDHVILQLSLHLIEAAVAKCFGRKIDVDHSISPSEFISIKIKPNNCFIVVSELKKVTSPDKTLNPYNEVDNFLLSSAWKSFVDIDASSNYLNNLSEHEAMIVDEDDCNVSDNDITSDNHEELKTDHFYNKRDDKDILFLSSRQAVVKDNNEKLSIKDEIVLSDDMIVVNFGGNRDKNKQENIVVNAIDNSQYISDLKESSHPYYICFICNDVIDLLGEKNGPFKELFQRRLGLRLHIGKHSYNLDGILFLTCPICRLLFRTSAGDKKSLANRLMRHVQEKHKLSYWLGGSKANVVNEYHVSPITRKKLITSYFCVYCIDTDTIWNKETWEQVGEKYDSISTLSEHIEDNHGVRKEDDRIELVCSLCENNFYGYTCKLATQQLLSHMSISHALTCYKTKSVEEEDSSSHNLTLAKEIRSSFKFRCMICNDNQEFISRHYFRKHIETHHVIFKDNEHVVQCCFCTTQFRTTNGEVRQTANRLIRHFQAKHNIDTGSQIATNCDQTKLLPDFIKYDSMLASSFSPSSLKISNKENTTSMSNAKILSDLISSSTSKPQFKCVFCPNNEKHFNHSNYRDHIEEEHLVMSENEIIGECKFCRLKFTTFDVAKKKNLATELLHHLQTDHDIEAGPGGENKPIVITPVVISQHLMNSDASDFQITEMKDSKQIIHLIDGINS